MRSVLAASAAANVTGSTYAQIPSKWCSASHSISIPSSSQSRASRSVSWIIWSSRLGSIDAGKRKLLNFISRRSCQTGRDGSNGASEKE
jgi:hypothetical protein